MLLLFTLVGAPALGVGSFVTAVRAEAPSRSDSAYEPDATAREWKSIVLHHSATAGGSVESIDAVHRRRMDAAGNPWLGIGYHFVIGNGHGMGDGEVQPTFRWRKQLQGAHAGRREENESGIGICLIGDFERRPPTDKQIAATRTLITSLAERYEIGPRQVLQHQEITTTLCPGRLFPRHEVLAGLRPAKGS